MRPSNRSRPGRARLGQGKRGFKGGLVLFVVPAPFPLDDVAADVTTFTFAFTFTLLLGFSAEIAS